MNLSVFINRERKWLQNFFISSVPLWYSTVDSFYGLLVAAAVLNLATCPFAVSLNTLVLVAVKTKRRLQTHPNFLLACLAPTDLMVGHITQEWGGGGVGNQLSDGLVVFPTHFNPENFLLILLQISLLFRCTPRLKWFDNTLVKILLC